MSCALSENKEVYCWGMNVFNSLGRPNFVDDKSPKPVQVVGQDGSGFLSNIKSISVGFTHRVCAVSEAGNIYCWGFLANGIPSDGTINSPVTPVSIPNSNGTGVLSDVKQVTVGDSHACALKNSGTVFCWGRGQFLGKGNSIDSNNPVQVLGVAGNGFLTSIISISAGGNQTCALSSSGYVFCWGSGNLGAGAVYNSYTPIRVSGIGGVGNLSGVTQISVSGNRTTCVVITSGEVLCWGDNLAGGLGNGTNQQSLTPVKVLGVGGIDFLKNIKQVSVANSSACATSKTGNIFCWGSNFAGVLGNGTTSNSWTPVQVSNPEKNGSLQNILEVSLGFTHACARSDTGRVFCWGMNGSGQLGNEEKPYERTLTPVEIKSSSL